MKAAWLIAVIALPLAALAQTPPEDPHAGHAGHAQHPAAEDDRSLATTAASLPVGEAPPPAIIEDHFADRTQAEPSMNRARDVLRLEHGGGVHSKVMADLLEVSSSSGQRGFRWNVEGRYGGDRHRVLLTSEGEAPHGDVDSGEVQALYSRAIGRYTDLHLGARYDFEPSGVAYAALGFETLLPYWFDVEGALFLSEHGDAFARFEGSYDLQITQRFILQPRVELTIAAQDVAASRLGSGLSIGEFGLRLRYDLRREFSPYLGVNFEKRFGRTADLVRALGDDVDEASVVVGLRAFF